MTAYRWRARLNRKLARLPHIRIPLFRIFYSTTYTTLFIVLLVLLAITPATIIYDAISNSAYQYLFMVGGAYIVTAVVTLLLYSSRLYSNRSTLAGVGKSYIPVEDGEVSKNVRKEIVRGLRRSALVAAEIRPRDLSGKDEIPSLIDGGPGFSASAPPWGTIERPGWSAPDVNASTSHIYYDSIVRELPNLIEARIVSLHDGENLQRAPSAGLRDYLAGLDIELPDNSDIFLALYEQARFRPRPLTTAEFQTLMEEFASFLRGFEPDQSEERGGNADAADIVSKVAKDPSLRSVSLHSVIRRASSRSSSLQSVVYAAREPV